VDTSVDIYKALCVSAHNSGTGRAIVSNFQGSSRASRGLF